MQWQAAQMVATWTVVAFLLVDIFIVVRTIIKCPKIAQFIFVLKEWQLKATSFYLFMICLM
jgi:hypothetical protein